MGPEDMVEYLGFLIKVMSILSVLSFVSCSLVVFLFLTKQHLQTYLCELLFHMAISEIFNSIAKFMSIYKLYYFADVKEGLMDETSTFCVIQRILGNYSDISSFILIVIISYTLHHMMLKMNKNIKDFMPCFRFCIYLIPLVMTLSISIITTEPEHPHKKRFQCWCWIYPELKILTYVMYGIYWTFIIANICMIYKTTDFLKSVIKITHDSEASHEEARDNIIKIKKVIGKLYLYPLVAFIIWLMATISRMFEIVYYDMIEYTQMTDTLIITRLVLYSLHSVLMSGRGLLYTLLYFNRYEKITAEMSNMWHSFCTALCCCKKKATAGESSNLRDIIADKLDSSANDYSIVEG